MPDAPVGHRHRVRPTTDRHVGREMLHGRWGYQTLAFVLLPPCSAAACLHRPGNLTAGDSLYPPPPPPLLRFRCFCSGAVEVSRSLSLARAATHMASSSDEQPKPPEPPAAAVAAAAQPHAEWAASLQAYYAAAGHPYAWPAQHLMAAAASGAPYGTPVPFPVYHPGAAMAYYAHASMAAGVTYPTAEAVAAAAEGKGKGKGGGASPEKGSSGAPSGDDDSRSGDSGSEESSDTRDDDTDHKDSSAPKKRKSGNTSAEGAPSQAAVVPCAAVESPYQVKGRSASKLPVSAPGRAALPNATPNLNIGIDLWSASPALDVPAGQGEANPGLALARRDGVAQLDDRELKRERRKQSNRESARRSRLRKQQECEELGRKVAELTTENSSLRTELDQLKKACEDMEAENTRLMDGMVQSQGPTVTTTLGMSLDSSKAQQHDDEGQLHKNTNNSSNGNYVGGNYVPEANSR